MISSTEKEAKQAIQDSEIMIRAGNYKTAKLKTEEAIILFPTIQNGKEMISLCEIHLLCETHKFFRNKSWPYTLLQLPISSTPDEVWSRFEELMADLKSLKHTFPGREAAIEELECARSKYMEEKCPNLVDRKGNASLLSITLVGYDCTKVDKKGRKTKDEVAAEKVIKAIEDAKHLLSDQYFKSAKAKVQHAIKIFPTMKFGKQMLTLCDILYNYRKFKPSSSRELWSCVLQIPSSSKESDAEARFEVLMDDVKMLCGWPDTIRFPGLIYAEEALRRAIRSFPRCNAAVSIDGENGDGGDHHPYPAGSAKGKKFPLESNRPCHDCGGASNPNAFVACPICKVSHIHTYCLLKKLVKVQERWICEQCMTLSSFQRELPDHLAKDATWKGSFEVLDSVLISGTHEGLQAHLPHKVRRKTYELAKEMPNSLQFKLYPRAEVWPKKFNQLSPTVDDIGLYFLPGDNERFRKSYDLLANLLMTTDSAIRSSLLDGWELLIFSSKQLPTISQGIQNQFFLWGVFQSVGNRNSSSSQPTVRTHEKKIRKLVGETRGPLLTPIREQLSELDPPPGFFTKEIINEGHATTSVAGFRNPTKPKERGGSSTVTHQIKLEASDSTVPVKKEEKYQRFFDGNKRTDMTALKMKS